MDKLTDPNPYEILDISPDADRTTIKRALANKQRKNRDRDQADRQQALKARNTLFSTEKRLMVDALIPDFQETGSTIDISLDLDNVEPISWRDIANPDELLWEDMQALIHATLRHILSEVPKPENQVTLSAEFDGLNEFLEDWLK